MDCGTLQMVMKMELYQVMTQIFTQLEVQLTEEEKSAFVRTPYPNLSRHHFGLGLYIRNRWLREGDRLRRLLEGCGIDQTDDMSALAVQLFYLYLRQKTDAGQDAPS